MMPLIRWMGVQDCRLMGFNQCMHTDGWVGVGFLGDEY